VAGLRRRTAAAGIDPKEIHVIVPDEKDWTWVLERPCPECGFDASSIDARDVASAIRDDAAAWAALHDAGRIAPGRPRPDRWSSLEYAAHVRDVYRIYDVRLALMVAEDDPLFANWDQDATAVAERYDEQDPDVVIADLVAAGTALAAAFDAVVDWARPGRRSDGASFTIDTFSRYLLHDPVHHRWDVERGGAD
jgi:hypothetical protein